MCNFVKYSIYRYIPANMYVDEYFQFKIIFAIMLFRFQKTQSTATWLRRWPKVPHYSAVLQLVIVASIN